MEFKNVVKLSDGYKYIIANQVEVDGKTYCQMLRVDSETDFFIAEKKNDEIIIIDDKKLILKVLSEIAKQFLPKNN